MLKKAYIKMEEEHQELKKQLLQRDIRISQLEAESRSQSQSNPVRSELCDDDP